MTDQVVLTLAVDFGGSSTKLIGKIPTKKRLPLIVSPHYTAMEKASVKSVDQYQNLSGGGDFTWISTGDGCYAIGTLAQLVGYQNLRLNQPKMAMAIHKVLGAVYLYFLKYNLPNEFALDLICVLPPSEYGERDALKEGLATLLMGFDTPGGHLSVKLNRFICKPEGFGILLSHWQNNIQIPKLKEQPTALIMIGHRNTNLIYFENGVLNFMRSSQLGFSWCVEKIVDKTSGYERDKIYKAIASYLHSKNEQHLQGFLVSNDPKIELEVLKEAIAGSWDLYSKQVFEWVDEQLPNARINIILCGGTSDLPLKVYKKELTWNIYDKVKVDLPPDIVELNMGTRFADLWAIWEIAVAVWRRESLKDKKLKASAQAEETVVVS